MTATGKVDRAVLSWLTECPAGDVNFKWNLARANLTTLRRAALVLARRDGKKSALARVTSRLRRLKGKK